MDGREPGPFALYLRPFVTTERLIAQPVADIDMGSGNDFPVHLDVETLLARALRGDCPLVALGRPGEVEVGAGRVVTDDDSWRAVIHAMAYRATLVVMVPLAHPGTLEELRFVSEQGLLGKTILLMPETVGGRPSGVVTTTETDRIFEGGLRSYDESEHHLDLRVEWTAAVDASRTLGIELPPQAAAGALFTIDPGSGRGARLVPLGLSSLSQRAGYLRSAIRWLTAPGASVADLVDMLEAASYWRGPHP